MNEIVAVFGERTKKKIHGKSIAYKTLLNDFRLMSTDAIKASKYFKHNPHKKTIMKQKLPKSARISPVKPEAVVTDSPIFSYSLINQ